MIESACVSVPDVASVTCTVNPYVPAVVGVPEIVVLGVPEVLSVSPGGSVPEITLHVYGVVPFVAVTDCEYAWPTVPPASDVVVMLTGDGGGASATVIESAWVSVPAPASVTCTVNPYVPLVVGVPEIVVLGVPVELIVRPGGRLPEITLHVYGVVPFVAVRDCEYAWPTVPPASVVVVMLTGGGGGPPSPMTFSVAVGFGSRPVSM